MSTSENSYAFSDDFYPSSWRLRSLNDYDQAIVVEQLYEDRPQYFSLKVYHGGFFSSTPDRTYDYGSITFVDFLKVHEFNVSDMDLIYPQFGYGFTPSNLWYYFKTPSGDLDTGLVQLRNVEDSRRLTSHIGVNGVREISLYVVREELNANTGKMFSGRIWRKPTKEDAPVRKSLF
jgi:hypothetical protein